MFKIKPASISEAEQAQAMSLWGQYDAAHWTDNKGAEDSGGSVKSTQEQWHDWEDWAMQRYTKPVDASFGSLKYFGEKE